MSRAACKLLLCGSRAVAEMSSAVGNAAQAGRVDEIQALLDAELPAAQQELAIQYFEKVITAYQNINQTLLTP